MSPSLRVISYGPPASGVAMRTNHFPSASGVTTVLPLPQEAVMVTFRPVAVPQKATLDFCCKTILSLKMEGRVTFASSEAVASSAASSTEKRFISVFKVNCEG